MQIEVKPVVTIQQVIEALALSGKFNQMVGSGAAADALAAAERELGRTLPPDMHTLYAAHDGGFFLAGNLHLWRLHPLTDPDLSVVNGADQLRAWQWSIPDQVIPFAGNGSESTYGLWLPRDGRAKPLVVEIGQSSEEAALAIVGDDLAGFLAGHAAFHIRLMADYGIDPAPALDLLGVPAELRSKRSSVAAYNRLLTWANPNLPDKSPDVYKRPWTPERIAEFAALPD